MFWAFFGLEMAQILNTALTTVLTYLRLAIINVKDYFFF